MRFIQILYTEAGNFLGAFFRREAAGVFAAARDGVFYALMALSLVAALLPQPNYALSPLVLLAKAAYEEFIFRYIVQETAAQLLKKHGKNKGIGPISVANLTASLIFAGMHFVGHSPFWAAATFFPSLVFGYAWDRWHAIIVCTAIHFAYNAFLFYGPHVY